MLMRVDDALPGIPRRGRRVCRGRIDRVTAIAMPPARADRCVRPGPDGQIQAVRQDASVIACRTPIEAGERIILLAALRTPVAEAPGDTRAIVRTACAHPPLIDLARSVEPVGAERSATAAAA